jgi:hypothetical protein
MVFKFLPSEEPILDTKPFTMYLERDTRILNQAWKLNTAAAIFSAPQWFTSEAGTGSKSRQILNTQSYPSSF